MTKIIEVTRNGKDVFFEVELKDKSTMKFRYDIDTFTEKDLYYSIKIAEAETAKETERTTILNNLKTTYENKEVDLNARN